MKNCSRTNCLKSHQASGVGLKGPPVICCVDPLEVALRQWPGTNHQNKDQGAHNGFVRATHPWQNLGAPVSSWPLLNLKATVLGLGAGNGRPVYHAAIDVENNSRLQERFGPSRSIHEQPFAVASILPQSRKVVETRWTI